MSVVNVSGMSLIDAFLGAILAGELVYFVYFFLLPDHTLATAFVAAMLGVVGASKVVALSFRTLGKWISAMRRGAHIPANCRDPLSDPVMLKKWEDQSWQLAVHGAMTLFEIYLLFFGGGGPGSDRWWAEPDTTIYNTALSSPCPSHVDHAPMTPLRAFYVIQLAIWFWTAFSCCCLEERRKDYLEMMAHHLMTISLVMESLYHGELGYGMVILFVHDSADVVLDLMKMVNYLKVEGAHGFFITEIVFVVNTYISWPYMRLYYFPFVLLPTPGVTFLGITLKQGRYEILCGEQGNHPVGESMLLLLILLHLFWWILMNRIALKIVMGKDPNEAGEEEYEATRKGGGREKSS